MAVNLLAKVPVVRPETRRRTAPFEAASQAQKDIFVNYRRQGKPVGEARAAAGLKWEQIYDAYAKDPVFLAEAREGDQFFLDKIEDKVEEAAFNGDMQTARWILERRRPERWGKNDRVQVTHAIEDVKQIREMSDEDILATFEQLGIDP